MRIISIVVAGTSVVLAIWYFSRTPASVERPEDVPSETASDSATSLKPAFSQRSRPSLPHPVPVAETSATTNLIASLFAGGEAPRLSPEQVEAFVVANKRSALSLLTAYRAARDTAYLDEALEKYPNDPKVHLTAYFNTFLAQGEATPEERQVLLERFTKTDPQNSLAEYLSANDYLKTAEPEKALQQFRNAYGKSTLQDYSMDFVQSAGEAYRMSGYSEAESKAMASGELLLPHLGQLKQAGVGLAEMGGKFQEGGEPEQAQQAREMALHLAGLLQDGSQQKLLINQLVGIAIEAKTLATLDPQTQYGDSGRTVQNRLDDLKLRRKELGANIGPATKLVPSMSPEDQAGFFDRTKTFGEEAALKWAMDKYGKSP